MAGLRTTHVEFEATCRDGVTYVKASVQGLEESRGSGGRDAASLHLVFTRLPVNVYVP